MKKLTKSANQNTIKVSGLFQSTSTGERKWLRDATAKLSADWRGTIYTINGKRYIKCA